MKPLNGPQKRALSGTGEGEGWSLGAMGRTTVTVFIAGGDLGTQLLPGHRTGQEPGYSRGRVRRG